jgi:hypothetical protein
MWVLGPITQATVPAKAGILTEYVMSNFKLLIDGRLVEGASRLDVINPATGRIHHKPRVTMGNPMAPCVLIGERAGEILRTDDKR